ncbi:MAG TPA: gamma carbonic anhydrase family protein [Myxococcota bacterium]|nr:gamma carbonic anhydrase family protein [Myxococcota bacterium]
MIESIKGYSPIISPKAFVHSGAHVIGQVIIEEGASIWPGVVLRGDMGLIKVGKNSSVQDGTVAHMTLGYSNTLIGDNVTIGHGVILHGCVIEDGCLIGMGSILLDEARIQSGSFVAAGSLITGNKTFDPGSFICGSPAKRLRAINEREQAMIEASVHHYLDVQKLYNLRKT